nr:ABC transporter permease [Aeromicrobium wangtongii]
MVIAASVLYPGFLDSGNLRNILSQNAALGIAAVGVTFVIIGAGFDLSVPAVVGIGAVVSAKLSDGSVVMVLLTVIMAGLVCGLINGLIVTRLRVNPFIATLGTSSIFTGATLLYASGTSISISDPTFIKIGQQDWFGLRISVWIMLFIFLIAGIVLWKTTFGRAVYAIGGNSEAARLAGVRVDLVRTTTYALSGVTSALAGFVIASTLLVGQLDVGQSGYALQAIAAVVIGGCSLFGGMGAIWRTAAGLTLLAVLTNLFNALAIQSAWQSIVQGAILIVTVGIDVATRSGRGRS